MEPCTSTPLIGIMMVNTKISSLNLDCSFVGNNGRMTTTPYHGEFGRTLLAVFRVNTMLVHLHLPGVEFAGTAMDERPCGQQKSFETLGFNSCIFDADNLLALGRWLEREDSIVDTVYLHTHIWRIHQN
jgi:hypothetical protein